MPYEMILLLFKNPVSLKLHFMKNKIQSLGYFENSIYLYLYPNKNI